MTDTPKTLIDQLSKLPLLELATRLVGACDLGLADRVDAIRAELSRRQALLDAAAIMYKMVRHGNEDAINEGLTVYAAATEEPSDA